MSSLRMFLPPFAADYAGALAALYDYDGVLALDNAMCCSTNYLTCDEPRRAAGGAGRAAGACPETAGRPVVGPRAVFGTGIRSADVVFGAEDKVVEQLVFALRRFGGQLAAVVGTPIPAMLGTDGTGIASRVEAATGVPCLNVATTGYAAYDVGVVRALDALVGRLGEKPARRGATRVNVVGATPLDLGTRGITGLTGLLAAGGFEVGCALGMGGRLEDVPRVGEAACNLAVSAAGVAVARRLQERFGTPWVACACAGVSDTTYGLARLAAVIAGDDPGDGVCVPAAEQAAPRGCAGARVLVVHDQVVANGVRRDLLGLAPDLQVDVASFFALAPEVARPGDRALCDERGLAELLARTPYGAVVGDPLLASVPGVDPARLTPLPHLAVSGRLSWENDVRLHGGSDGAHRGVDEVVRRFAEALA